MPNKRLPGLALLAAGALAGVIAVAGCQSGGPVGSTAPASSRATSAAAAPARAGTLNWHPCRVQGAHIRCASLQVPLNYRDPAGRKITLALDEVPASAPAAQQQVDLLVNPGGPGAGGGNHGQSLSQPPNTCVNGYLNRYLASGALPQRPGLVNAVCPALPPPPPLT